MKKYFAVIILLAFAVACGSPTETKVVANPSADPDYQKGLDLVVKSDCFTCHKLNEKFTGPTYKDVANKYENTDANVALLADKIRNGGTGVWGQIPMIPHASISEADARQMVKYILLLRNK